MFNPRDVADAPMISPNESNSDVALLIAERGLERLNDCIGFSLIGITREKDNNSDSSAAPRFIGRIPVIFASRHVENI